MYVDIITFVTPDISVIIPSYNEMTNLQKGVLDKVEHYLEKNHPNYEVIVSDDGSQDGSLEFVDKFTKENKKFRLIKNPHLGKAGAVSTGMLAAKGKLVLFTDMDQATPIEEMAKLLPYVQDFDIVIGSRHSTRKGAPFTRKIMANSMIFLRTFLVGLRDISDTQCGFKMFKKETSDKLFSKVTTLHSGFRKIKGSAVSAGFDVELLYIAEKMGFKIKEVPVEWLYVETRRVSPIKDSIEGLKDLARIKQRIITNKYEL